MTALHASSQTLLHLLGGACAFHAQSSSTLGSLDYNIWHSSLSLPKLGLKQRLSCINAVISIPAH